MGCGAMREAKELQRAPHAAMSLGRHVGDELRGAGEAFATNVMAGRRQQRVGERLPDRS
jgi:hypothetical protein